jgi:HlyD family secretion protein/epimerase transport system membrane fusion protein
MKSIDGNAVVSGEVLSPEGMRVVDALALRRDLRRPRRIGVCLVLLFLAAFVGWGALVPIAGGAIAPGVISPDGNRKTVQHLEGGIISKLLVRDGDVVSAGQPIVLLEGILPKAAFDMLVAQQWTLMAMRARLFAEQTGLPEVEFPPEILQTTDQRLKGLVDGQRRLFADRLATHTARKSVLRQRAEQLKEQIKGLQAQVDSAAAQLGLIDEELVGKEELHAKKIVAKLEILRVRRTVAEIEGRRGEYMGAIARAKEQIAEIELQILTAEAERADQVTTQLEQVRVELATVTEKLNSSADILKRTVITAPLAGTVVNMRFTTEGGVLRAAEPILDIVPAEDMLLIDARVAPNDIDVVHAGLAAKVQLSAYSTRSVPRMNGIIRSVSADRLIDDNSRQPYYLARVNVDREEIKSIAPNVVLVPGMPADVLIVTGERTMARYILQPFLDAIWRSFRET